MPQTLVSLSLHLLFLAANDTRAARTFPASGSFTSAQADLYGALLSAQKQLVALCTARSGLSLAQLHHRSVELLGKELTRIGFDLGVMGGRLTELYPHFIGHPVGIGTFQHSLGRAGG